MVKPKHIGEIVVATNGQKMTLIEYLGADNITVEFEDGTKVNKRTYQSFKKGNIKNPNYIYGDEYQEGRIKDYRIGEQSMSSCGLMMTIIKYRNATDIDVKFQDGTVVKHIWYRRFQDGHVKHPIAGNDGIRLGMSSVNKYGRDMKIVAYRNSLDIEVQFEDGTIVNTTYDNFKNKSVLHPKDALSIRRLGETSRAINGQMMTIVRYHTKDNIDVQFEDGTIVNTIYRYFKEGTVGNPNKTQTIRHCKMRVGEKTQANNGQIMTIIAYRKANDIDVKFEDGTLVTNKTYHSFKIGNIANPNHPAVKSKVCYKKYTTTRVGETSIANNGQKMTILEYRKSSDIKVQFEDGYISDHKTYRDFKLGQIRNPNVSLKEYSKK